MNAIGKLWIWLLASGLWVGCVAPTKALPEGPYLVALGTAQDGGLPQLGCRRACCERARKDPKHARLVTSLLLVDPQSGERWLFDASPDLPEQVERAREHESDPQAVPAGRPALFDGIFLTHAHLGHYTGLLHLGREAYGSATTEVYATPRLLAFLQSEGPWSLLFEAEHLRPYVVEMGVPVQLNERLRVTAWPVPHRDEFSDTVGFWIEGPHASALYLPDIDKWSRWDQDLTEVLAGIDYALVDGTFFGSEELPGRDMAEVPHPFIVETLQLLEATPKTLRQKVWFTHLNHSNPAADRTSPAAQTVRAAGAHILQEREILEL